MTRYALLFPGQGSQYVGMGESLYESQSLLFDEAEAILSIPLRKLMFSGPIEELTKTAIAQPAILLHSIAALRHVQKNSSFSVTAVLGHSLGEYSALVCAGVISLADAIKAVHLRGQFMQSAVPVGAGAMAAVLGMDASLIEQALLEFADDKKSNYATIANFNGPLQTVIAGTTEGVARASAKLKSQGAKRVIDLPVSAPFHCALMEPVKKLMADVLNDMTFKDAHYPVISNVTAQSEKDGEKIRSLMLTQIASAVRFTDCIHYIKAHNLGGDSYLELGPKNTLCGIVKKIDADAKLLHVDSLHDQHGI